jgi:hypothetical protein
MMTKVFGGVALTGPASPAINVAAIAATITLFFMLSFFLFVVCS